jgi:putative heme-binding domain-containing protein
VLSSIKNRAGEFIAEFLDLAENIDAGALEILRNAARSFATVAEMRQNLETHSRANAAGREGILSTLMALLLGVVERSGEKLDAKPGDKWMGPVLDSAVSVATDGKGPAEERALAVQLLGRMTWAKAGTPLLQIATTENDQTLRAASIRAVASFDEPEVVSRLIAADGWTRATPNQREVLLDALISRPFHAAGVLAAIEDGRLPANAIPTNRRATLLKLADNTLRDRAEALFGKVSGNRQAAFEAAKAALTLPPKPNHGRELFAQLCASCHRLDRVGYAVGPDLFDIRNQPKENILFHILVPDAEIAPAFAAYMAETTDGRTVSGILSSETPTSITLRGPLAQDAALLRTELKSLQALPNSLMPAGLEQAMSLQDQADLLAYLKGE